MATRTDCIKPEQHNRQKNKDENVGIKQHLTEWSWNKAAHTGATDWHPDADHTLNEAVARHNSIQSCVPLYRILNYRDIHFQYQCGNIRL